MDELKACPFCGGEAEVEQSHYNGKWFVACQNEPEHNVRHFENGGRYLIKQEAVEEWNRRAQPENNPLTLEELRQKDGEPVYYTWDNMGWGVVAILNGEPTIMIPSNDGRHYTCTAYSPLDYDGISYAYAHKPEQEENHEH